MNDPFATDRENARQRRITVALSLILAGLLWLLFVTVERAGGWAAILP